MIEQLPKRDVTLGWLAAMSREVGQNQWADGYLMELLAWMAFAGMHDKKPEELN